jgi:hypothetical protein
MSEDQIRASDAERDDAIEHLRDAAGAGRLTLEELADRIETAGRATTRGELDTVTADLPVRPAPAAAAPTHSIGVFGDLRRSGAWRVPERSRWTTIFGDVVLDLREAQVSGAELRIAAATVFGDVELLVPEGVTAEISALTVFGDVKEEAGPAVVPGAPRVLLTGGTVFGDVRVRAARR